MSETETQTTADDGVNNSDAVTMPDDFKYQDTKEFKGLTAAKAEATRNLHDVRQENARLQGQLEVMTSQQQQQQQTTATQEGQTLDDMQDDDVMTVGQVKAFREKDKAERSKQESDTQQAAQAIRFTASEAAAQLELTIENQGEGLDYDTVIHEGFKQLAKANSGHMAVVNNAPDPAKAAYEIGLTHPVIKARLKEKENTVLLADIKRKSAGADSFIPSGPMSKEAMEYVANQNSIANLSKKSMSELEAILRDTEGLEE